MKVLYFQTVGFARTFFYLHSQVFQAWYRGLRYKYADAESTIGLDSRGATIKSFDEGKVIMEKNDSLPINLCPKCKGSMERGRLLGSKYTSFASDAERKKIIGGGIRVTAYRCQNCGYCEIYAQGSPRVF